MAAGRLSLTTLLLGVSSWRSDQGFGSGRRRPFQAPSALGGLAVLAGVRDLGTAPGSE